MTWLILLLLLLCPISMMFMMKGHNHGGQHKHGNKEQHSHDHHTGGEIELPRENARLESYKVKQLEGELELLKNQNAMLQQRVEKLSNSMDYKS